MLCDMTPDEMREFAEAVSLWLFTLAFDDSKDNADMPLPPVPPGSTVLRDIRHRYDCSCPICMGRA